MFTSPLTSFAIISAFVGFTAAATGTFEILTPGGPNLWWVANSQNTLAWTCHTNPPAISYTLLVANTNPTILAAPEAIVANIPNADCSHSITTQQAALTPATNYTLLLADITNQTNIYATSLPFEVKALGASYPSASATPTEGSTSSTGAAASGSSTGSGSSSTSTSKPNSAFAPFKASTAGVLAAVGVAIGML